MNNSDSTSAIERAYLQIKQLMFQQQLIPGQKLLYRELCNKLNMSKTPIISALNRLEQEGFVVSETFYGYHIKLIDAQEIMDSFEVREALEEKAVKLAIKNSREEDIILLEEKLLVHEQYRPHKYDKKKFFLDAEFHLQIATMTRNSILKYLLKRNLEHIILRARLDDYDPRRMTPSASEHRKLLDGIKKKDVLGCVELINLHINKGRDYVLNCLSRDELKDLKTNDFLT